jgi:hypothetical protein
MKTRILKHLALGVALAAGLAVAKADLITYSVGSASVNVASDTVALGAISAGTVTLVDNGPAVLAALNGVTWTWTTPDPIQTQSTTISRNMTITVAAGSQTLQQTVQVKVTSSKANGVQDLTIESALPVDFYWTASGQAYDLAVTPEAFSTTSKGGTDGTVSGLHQVSGTLEGSFTLNSTPVPEPTTLISGALLILPFGASTLRILRRKACA